MDVRVIFSYIGSAKQPVLKTKQQQNPKSKECKELRNDEPVLGDGRLVYNFS